MLKLARELGFQVSRSEEGRSFYLSMTR
jgi:Mor family transcriptional regulator